MNRFVVRPLWALALTFLVFTIPASAGPIAWELYTTADDYQSGNDLPGNVRVSGVHAPDAPLSGSDSWIFPEHIPVPLMEFSPYTESGGIPPGTANFSLNVHLRDVASGQAAMLVFGGHFKATSGGDVIDTDPTFTTPHVQSVTLGENLYTLAAFLYEPAYHREEEPSMSRWGSVGGSLTVEPVTAEAPEPCTLALAGLGLAGAGVAGWRRRRRDRRNAAHAAP